MTTRAFRAIRPHRAAVPKSSAAACCHTYLPLTGRNYAVLTNKGERFPLFMKEKVMASGAQPMNNLHMIDVSNPAEPGKAALYDPRARPHDRHPGGRRR